MKRITLIALLLFITGRAEAEEACVLASHAVCDEARSFADFINQNMTAPREGAITRIFGATASDDGEVHIKGEYLETHEELLSVAKRDGITPDEILEKVRSMQRGLACAVPMDRIIRGGGKYRMTYYYVNGDIMVDIVVSSCPPA